MDVHEPSVRSFNMSRIKAKDTKPEMMVRRFLFSNGLRYRLHEEKLPGKPDIVFRRLKKIVLVHGCFWHGHDGCDYFVVPKTRTAWWLTKINGNKERDRANLMLLKRGEWKVIVIFECDLKPQKREKTLRRVLRFLSKK
ncbi:very short patch repair endonuclease [soil metagenome]